MTSQTLTHRAQAAYGKGATAIRTPRGTEYAVFAQVTRRIKEAAEKQAKVGKAAFPELASALHDNLRLWSVLATDVLSPGNELSEELRAGILGLSQFTRAHTSGVLQGSADVRPILEINIAIMKGLAGKVSTQ